ncbi:argininosuccinate synthase [Fusarium heterosporum]|uniref:argininosuccinate synthase n=1 Tax=Fusarium heterosporum TaxID=42747 RepID=A0A8H5SSX2_FUSHE|nr:argininosuccinate synthase [Fusarium heterosporum]
MGERSKVGLLGFGHANSTIDAYLATCGLATTAWTLPCHRENGYHETNYTNGSNNAHTRKEATSLQELVEWHECLVLAAPADAQELYIAALEELNSFLHETILIVVDGCDPTLLSGDRLKVKHVIESHIFRASPKLANGKSALNGNGMNGNGMNGNGVNGEVEPSRPGLNGHASNPMPGLPEYVRSLLQDLARFNSKDPQRETGSKNGLGKPIRQNDDPIESFGHIAQYGDRHNPVVTMFSGGLDSTYMLLKLKQLGFTNVHAVAVDLGGLTDEDQLTQTAAHFGATFTHLDGRELFVRNGVTSAIRAHARYLGTYPISSSLSRPVIARLTSDYAKSLNAGLLLHTANLSQNSLPRLNNSIRHYGFPGQFGSPYVRSVVSREQKAQELSAVGLTFKSDRKLSSDENLWCREFESGPLDNPESFDIPEDAYQWTAPCGHYAPEKLSLTFEKGNLVSVNGDRLPLVEAIALLNKEVGKFGHGRYVGLEPIRTDEKVLEVREAPAATIIMDALRHLEVAVLESNTLELKQSLEQKWVAEAISGRWESSCHSMCDAAIASALNRVGGTVTYRIDHARYLPCSIVADTPRYIQDRDEWEYKESLRLNLRS